MIETWIVMTTVGFLSGTILLLMIFTFMTFQKCMEVKTDMEAFKRSTHRIQYINPMTQESGEDPNEVLGQHEQEYYTKGVEEDLDGLIDQMEDDITIYDSRSNLS